VPPTPEETDGAAQTRGVRKKARPGNSSKSHSNLYKNPSQNQWEINGNFVGEKVEKCIQKSM
jgi:hypothetical protein